MNYFAIERNGECWSPVILADSHGNPAFEEFLNMTYDEMKSNEQLDDFVAAAMEAADRKSEGEYDDTVVTLVGEDGFFIWGIIMASEGDDIRYSLVDWKKDGMRYKYTE